MMRIGLDWDERVSSDDDTVDRFLHDGSVVPESPSEADLSTAIEWLALYSAEDAETAQAFANVIGLLDRKISEKRKRAATAQSKREYAQANGIPVSRVRVVK